jgi:hypothetical protein
VTIAPGQEVPDWTVVYGPGLFRTDTTGQSDKIVIEGREVGHEKMLKGLKTLIPSNLAKWQ